MNTSPRECWCPCHSGPREEVHIKHDFCRESAERTLRSPIFQAPQHTSLGKCTRCSGCHEGTECHGSSNLVQPENKGKPHLTSSFIENTLEEFRESLKPIIYEGVHISSKKFALDAAVEWLSSKLDQAFNEGKNSEQAWELGVNISSWLESGRMAERARIIEIAEELLNDPPAESIEHTDGFIEGLTSLIEKICKEPA